MHACPSSRGGQVAPNVWRTSAICLLSAPSRSAQSSHLSPRKLLVESWPALAESGPKVGGIALNLIEPQSNSTESWGRVRRSSNERGLDSTKSLVRFGPKMPKAFSIRLLLGPAKERVPYRRAEGGQGPTAPSLLHVGCETPWGSSSELETTSQVDVSGGCYSDWKDRLYFKMARMWALRCASFSDCRMRVHAEILPPAFVSISLSIDLVVLRCCCCRRCCVRCLCCRCGCCGRGRRRDRHVPKLCW